MKILTCLHRELLNEFEGGVHHSGLFLGRSHPEAQLVVDLIKWGYLELDADGKFQAV